MVHWQTVKKIIWLYDNTDMSIRKIAKRFNISETTVAKYVKTPPRTEGKMYVYIESEHGLWTVGFYRPDGRWEPESDHNDKEEAAKRVAYLNGSGK